MCAIGPALLPAGKHSAVERLKAEIKKKISLNPYAGK